MSVIHGLIPAGGVGARAQVKQDSQSQPSPKQYRLIGQQPMLWHAAKALMADARVRDVVVGVQADDDQAQACLQAMERIQVLPSAGSSRAQTVLQTLQQAQFEDRDWVLVHDAARPGLPADRLAALIDCCLQHNQGGILAMPAADTVKLADSSSTAVARVQSTLARQMIWLAQTPQMFRVAELKTALSGALHADVDVTDEASAMEWAGHGVLLVPGSSGNLKVTWPDDFEQLGDLS